MKITKNIILVGSLLGCLSGAYATEVDEQTFATTDAAAPEQAQISSDEGVDKVQAAPDEAETSVEPNEPTGVSKPESRGAGLSFKVLEEILATIYFVGDKWEGEFIEELENMPLETEKLNQLGWHYYQSGHKRDILLSASYYRKAAEQGNAEAQKMLGYCYFFRDEPETAAVWFRQAAEQGNAEAQVALGKCYFEGHGVKKDLFQAFTWFRKAAEQGDSEAWYHLGICYETYRSNTASVVAGIGVVNSWGKAFVCYRKAAEKGVAGAQFRLAHCYMYGRGVGKNEEVAFKLYEKVSKEGGDFVARARTELAKCYLYGKGVKQDMKKAYDEIAYVTGIKKFSMNVEGKKVERSYGYFANPYMALPEARYTLAKCLLYGWGCEQDKKEAKKLLESLGNYRAAKEMLKAH